MHALAHWCCSAVPFACAYVLGIWLQAFSKLQNMADKAAVFQTVAIEYCAPAVDELQRQLQAAREEIEKLKLELKRARDELDEWRYGPVSPIEIDVDNLSLEDLL